MKPARRRGTTRDMMVTKTNGAPVRPDAPVFIGGAWAVDPSPPAPPEPAAAVFEVVRVHTDCRVQLAGWGIPTAEKAEALAAQLNGWAEAAGGFTLATSGHLERGWVYKARRGSS